MTIGGVHKTSDRKQHIVSESKSGESKETSGFKEIYDSEIKKLESSQPTKAE